MPASKREIAGIGAALVSATAFGATAIIAKFAYTEGVNVSTLLVTRFILGAGMLWGLVYLMGVGRSLARRDVGVLLALGFFGYGTQSRMVFESLARIPAGTAILLLYAYPAIVAGLAFALKRERVTAKKLAVLAAGLTGVALVMGGPSSDVNTAGVVLALGGAVVYAVYITVVTHAMQGVHPLHSSAIIMTGGAAAFVATGAVTGSLAWDITAPGWMWLVALAFVSVTVAVSTFLMAVERIGATRASIASTFEPVVAVALGALVLDERLGVLQVLGGVLVVAAVAALPALGRRPGAEGEMPVMVGEEDWGGPGNMARSPFEA